MTTAAPLSSLAAQGPQPLPEPAHKEVAQGIAYASRLRDGGDVQGALNLFRKMRQIEPDSLALRFLAATLEERQGRFQPAEKAYAAVLAAVPRHVASLVRRAACLASLRRPLEALDLLAAAAALDPSSGPVNNALGRHLLSLRRYREAALPLATAAEGINTAAAWADAANAFDRAGEPDKAADAYAKALAVASIKAPLHVRLSTMALVRGDRARARQHLADALASDPGDGYAHLSLATHFPAEADETAIRTSLATAPGRPAALYGAPLTFALARVLDRDGKLDEAFDAYVEANALVAKLQRPPADLKKILDARLATYTAGFIASHQSWGHRSDQPVFVSGLPRSGTTLVEQIIASHPEAIGLGEFEALLPLIPALGANPERDAVRRSAAAYLAARPPEAANARRTVDKSLSTWMLIGPAMLLFPNARFVHVARHPMDTAWSIFTELFADNALPDAYSFERIAALAHLEHATMEGWTKAFPDRILTVRYEQLVADPETETRRIIAHLHLDWNGACLAPHETKRTIRTASTSQVRQPVHAGSVGRWRRYEHRLAPLADLMSDLVSAYESGPRAP